MSILCSSTGEVGQTIKDSSGSDAGSDCQKPQCSIQGIYPGWYPKECK
jgi:hypothetical protein